MKRPLVYALLFLICGIVFGRYFHYSIALFLIVVSALALLFYCKFKHSFIIALPVLAALGFVLVTNSLSPKDVQIEGIAVKNGIVKIEAVVQEVSLTKTNRQKVIIRTQALQSEDDIYPIKMLVSAVLPVGGKVQLGQKVMLEGELLLLDFARNPGAFDEFQYLRSNKIQYKMFPEKIQKYDVFLTPAMYIKKMRVKLAKTFDSALPPRQAGIMKAMIIGDTSALDEETKDLYKDAGIYHILSVSGLHVGILAVCVRFLLELAKINRKRSGIVTMVFLLFYAVLTGCSISTMRALIMSYTLIVGELSGRDNDSLSSVCFAAILLLLYEPMYLTDIGFIYSFGSVLALVLGTNPTKSAILKLVAKFPRLGVVLRNFYTKKYLAPCLAVCMAYIPINTYFFYHFSPISVVVNLLLLPTVFIVTVLGFVMALTGLFGLLLPQIVSVAVTFLLVLYEMVCTMALSIPYATILTGRPNVFFMLAFLLASGLFIYVMKQAGEVFKRNIKFFCGSLGLLVLSAFLPGFVDRNVNITFLDIGQGDSAVIAEDGRGIIIDGGGYFYKDIGDNTGVHVLLPYLDYMGIAKAEAAFVSHNDADHALGIVEALLEKRIKKLFIAEIAVDTTDDIYNQLIEAAQESRTPVVYLKAGDSVVFKTDITIDCLYPDTQQTFVGNNASLVLRVNYGKSSFLFTGDIEKEGEQTMLNLDIDISADVLKVAHHGSKTSTTKGFLEAVSPEIAVISAGRNNAYGHPSAQTLERLAECEIEYIATPENGAVMMYTDGNKIKIKTMGEQDERIK